MLNPTGKKGGFKTSNVTWAPKAFHPLKCVAGWTLTHMAGCPRSGSWWRCGVSWPLSSCTSGRSWGYSDREKKKMPANIRASAMLFHVLLLLNFQACSSKLLGFSPSPLSVTPIWVIQYDKTTTAMLPWKRSVDSGTTWNSSRKSLASSASFLL